MKHIQGMRLAAPLSIVLALSFASAAHGAFELNDSFRCGAGFAKNGISIGDVTGDLGGATECWGTYDGNDPATDPSFDVVSSDSAFDGLQFSYLSKFNTGNPPQLEGDAIGLEVDPSGGAKSGTWKFDPTKFTDRDPFLLVLKQANNPGFGVWLFQGTDANSYSGNWNVAWSDGLSHLAIHRLTGGGDTPPNGVPEPGTLALMGLGVLGFMARRRRRFGEAA